MGQILMTQAHALFGTGKHAAAETAMRRALEIRTKHYGAGHPMVGVAMNDLGYMLAALGRHADAEKWLVRALETARAPGALPENLLGGLWNLADVRQARGDLAGAEEALREGVAWIEASGTDRKEHAALLGRLGHMRRGAGDVEGAIRLFQESLAAKRRDGAPPGAGIFAVYVVLGGLLLDAGRPDEAAKVLEEGLPGMEKALGDGHDFVLRGRIDLAWSLRERDPKRAERLLRVNQKNLAKQAAGSPWHVETLRGLATLFADGKRWEEAEGVRRALLALRRKQSAEPGVLAQALVNLVAVLFERGRFAEAEPLAQEGLTLREKALPEGHWLRFSAACLLGRALVAQQKYAQAEPIFAPAYEAFAKAEIPAAGEAGREDARKALVAMYEGLGKPEKAAAWKTDEP